MVIWHQRLRTILIVRKETRCRHIGYSFRLTARVLLYAQSHRQDSTYHSLCYTSRGALAGMRNSSMGSPHEGSIRRPITPVTWKTGQRGCMLALPTMSTFASMPEVDAPLLTFRTNGHFLVTNSLQVLPVSHWQSVKHDRKFKHNTCAYSQSNNCEQSSYQWV